MICQYQKDARARYCSMMGARLGFPPHYLQHRNSHMPFSQPHFHSHSHGQLQLLGFVVNRTPFAVARISYRMSDMEANEVDYSSDPNPYELICTCPNAPPKSTTVVVQFLPFSQFSLFHPIVLTSILPHLVYQFFPSLSTPQDLTAHPYH